MSQNGYGRPARLKFGPSSSTSNSFPRARTARYWLAGKTALRNAKDTILSVVLDATRMAKKNMLYIAVWSSRLHQGFWLLPQASHGKGAGREWP